MGSFAFVNLTGYDPKVAQDNRFQGKFHVFL